MTTKLLKQAREALKLEREVVSKMLDLTNQERRYQHYQALLQAEKRQLYLKSIIEGLKMRLETGQNDPYIEATNRRVICQMIGERASGLNIYEDLFSSKFNEVVLVNHTNQYVRFDEEGETVLTTSAGYGFVGRDIQYFRDFAPLFRNEIDLILETKREIERNSFTEL